MFGTRFGFDVTITRRDIDNLVDAGLGPLFHHILHRHDRLAAIDTDMRLKAADSTSRALSGQQFRNLEEVIGLLNAEGISPTLLKGASFATRYYPAPHLRIMGDIDLLLPPDAIGVAEQILLHDGFEQHPGTNIDYDTHLHSAPLFHRHRQLWIELHRCLLPGHFAASDEAPLNLAAIGENTAHMSLADRQVTVLSTELELIYLAAGWCFDLTHGFGRPGLQRTLFDCTLLLKSGGQQLDWPIVLRWSNGTLSGACLFILLSYLKRIEVFDDSTNLCDTLENGQGFVNSLTLGLMHERIDTHLVGFGRFGRIATPTTLSNMFDSLIRQEAAWKNLLAIPWRIVFPRRVAQRYKLAYQLDRLRRMMRRAP